MRAPELIRMRRRRDPESGQATTEFALILFPLLLLVGGIIYFGIALNFWLDMQRIANQGARWAVVDAYPACPRTGPTTCSPTLQMYLEDQALSQGLQNSVCVDILFPDGQQTAGHPVTVRLESPFSFIPILGIGTITLGADATMRLEWEARHYTEANNTC